VVDGVGGGGGSGTGAEELSPAKVIVYQDDYASVVLRDTAIYSSAEKYEIMMLKWLTLRK
jgi:uncharacterized spore protein YtfJ